MPVTTTKAEYDKMLKRVTPIRDCVQGQSAIKDKTTTYLPQFTPEDVDRYNKYIERAILTNYTARTKNGFIGMVNREKHTIGLPPEIEYLREDADGAGKSIEELVSDIVGALQEAGTDDYLVDYTTVPDGASMEDEVELGARVTLKNYPLESKINWRLEVGNGKTKPVMIVLKELSTVVDPKDKFEATTEDQYRVLEIDERGKYFQAVYDQDSNMIEGPIYPKISGAEADEITYVTIGSESNDFTLDKPMLEDITYLNIGHYRNSADYEESCHISGQGYLIVDIGDMSQSEFKAANPSGITFGSRSGLAGSGYKGQLLQMGENPANLEAMTKKEEQMQMIAAKLITPKTAEKTAEGERIDAASENSQLSTLVSNAETGLTKMLKLAAKYEGANPDLVEVKLNRNFYPETITPQEAVAFIQLYDRGIVDNQDIRNRLKETNWVDKNRDDATVTDNSGMIND